MGGGVGVGPDAGEAVGGGDGVVVGEPLVIVPDVHAAEGGDVEEESEEGDDEEGAPLFDPGFGQKLLEGRDFERFGSGFVWVQRARLLKNSCDGKSSIERCAAGGNGLQRGSCRHVVPWLVVHWSV